MNVSVYKLTNTLLIIFSLLIFSTSSNARDIPVGIVEIGGGLEVSISDIDTDTEVTRNTYEKSNTKTITLDASSAYYIAPNFGVGMAWFYESEKTTTDSDAIG